MFRKKECVAMLLAGGQGSRLYVLTTKTAKPAVSFGGKYRIIDFTLSNCVNSGIDTVGVLTQYQPLVLNEYIGNGLPWDLDRTYGGVKILPPYQGQNGADWYRGTANAIYQNMEFINRYDPEYVLILSGDHIYKMDYAKMLQYHKKMGADCTIAVIDVPIEEASRFGIMSTNEDNSIYKFSEKPKEPDSTKASMGIYIFNRKKLAEYLEADNADPNSSYDFGKNIIPTMLAKGERMFAYPFEGYWKDVGTISSLWEANMDLLGEHPELTLDDESWRIFARHYADAPQYVGPTASVINSSITEGCEIEGQVINCVLGTGVKIERGALVKDSVLMDNVTVGAGAEITYSILAPDVTVGGGARLGAPRETAAGVTVIGEGVAVPAGRVIRDNEMIAEI
jgi:glucose-1-phosphate adenylyltransferase